MPKQKKTTKATKVAAPVASVAPTPSKESPRFDSNSLSKAIAPARAVPSTPSLRQVEQTKLIFRLFFDCKFSLTEIVKATGLTPYYLINELFSETEADSITRGEMMAEDFQKSLDYWRTHCSRSGRVTVFDGEKRYPNPIPTPQF